MSLANGPNIQINVAYKSITATDTEGGRTETKTAGQTATKKPRTTAIARSVSARC